MPLMVIAAVCSKCAQIRAKSRFTFQRGEAVKAPLKAADFEPTAGQPQPIDGQPMVCAECNAVLQLRPVPIDTANGDVVRPPAPEPPPPPAPTGVTTLFAAQAGEELREMRNLGDRIMVITNKRIVVIDPSQVVEGLL